VREVRVRPVKTGVFADTPAVVVYQIEPEKQSSGRSTGKGMTRIYARDEYVTQVKSHHPQWTMILIMSLIVVVLPYRRYRKAMGVLACH